MFFRLPNTGSVPGIPLKTNLIALVTIKLCQSYDNMTELKGFIMIKTTILRQIWYYGYLCPEFIYYLFSLMTLEEMLVVASPYLCIIL